MLSHKELFKLTKEELKKKLREAKITVLETDTIIQLRYLYSQYQKKMADKENASNASKKSALSDAMNEMENLSLEKSTGMNTASGSSSVQRVKIPSSEPHCVAPVSTTVTTASKYAWPSVQLQQSDEMEGAVGFDSTFLVTQQPIMSESVKLAPLATSASANNTQSKICEIDLQMELLRKEREFLRLKAEIEELRNASGTPGTMETSEISTPSSENRTFARRQLKFEDVAHSMRAFTGDDFMPIRKWLSDYEDHMAGETDPTIRLAFARRLLEGTAKSFLHTIKAATYEELKQKLLEEFDMPLSRETTFADLTRRTRLDNETLRQYVIAMQEIAAQGDVMEYDLVQLILDGMRENSPAASLLYGATSIKELKEALTRFERRVRRIKLAPEPPHRLPPPPSPGHRREMFNQMMDNQIYPRRQPQQPALRMYAMNRPPQLRRVQPPSPPREYEPDEGLFLQYGRAPGLPQSGNCFNCRRPGHRVFECTLPRRPPRSCFHCGSLEHWRRDCPRAPRAQQQVNVLQQRQRPQQEQMNLNEIDEGVPEDPSDLDDVSAMHPVRITFIVDEKRHKLQMALFSLFDTGSPVSFVRKSSVPKEVKLKELQPSSYHGLGNNKVTSHGTIEANITFIDQTHSFNKINNHSRRIFTIFVITRS